MQNGKLPAGSFPLIVLIERVLNLKSWIALPAYVLNLEFCVALIAQVLNLEF